MSRRLRPCGLLLLVPVLMASTSPSLAVTGPPHHLAIVGLPPELLLNACIPLSVEVHDSNGAEVKPLAPVQVTLSSTLLGGTFHESSSCTSPPITAVLIPTDNSGRLLWFRASVLGAVALSASDGMGGLDDAGSGVRSVVASLTSRLELSGVPPLVQAGVPITVTVTAKNANGIASGYAGTIHFTSTAPRKVLPQDYTFNPALDGGSKSFSVTFQSTGAWELKVEDLHDMVLQHQLPSIPVAPGPALRFEVVVPPLVTAGEQFEVRVIPRDAEGNEASFAGQVKFSTTVPKFKLPEDTSSHYQFPTEFNATLYSASPTQQTITVTDLSSGQGITGSGQTVVQHGPLARIAVKTSPNPVPACGHVKIELEALDAWDNVLVDEPITGVSICKPQSRSATFVSTTLQTSIPSSYCISGVLMGRAEALWKNSEGEDVEFSLSYGSSGRTSFTVVWEEGLPNPATSTLKFSESSEPLPALRTYTGQLTLELDLRDGCGKPVELDSGQTLTFASDTALTLSQPPVQVQPGRWTVTARLPECPENPSQSLAIWPLIDNEPLYRSTSQRFERRVLPHCIPPAVQIEVLTPSEPVSTEPGAMVEFEVKVSNSEDPPITDGLLMVSANGLTVLSASLDNQPLAAKGEGFVLPELRKDAPQTVRLTAQVSVTSSKEVKAHVWCAHSDGTLLTEKKSVVFNPGEVGVDVGCGCHAATLPGQVWPWLALLLAASRPWERLRRLRRSERNHL
ncbi:hypothetical protein [Hyalangium gracile]|uniref:hypothetical protein n=1 Tax=Hyalangium gracile TaxID=394092 RepID=UPI001CCE3279|nr:hypothetical protein [Hyalangium gracile]